MGFNSGFKGLIFNLILNKKVGTEFIFRIRSRGRLLCNEASGPMDD
jgi:hypothetical protein